MPGTTAQGGITKAQLKIRQPKEGGNGSEIKTIEFLYNPKQWSLTRSARWEAPQGKADGRPQFKGTNPSSINVDMFLDATTKGAKEIEPVVETLMKCVRPEPNSKSKKQPSAPHVEFQWGKIVFSGYIESVAVTYTMFDSKGTPLRGTVKLAIKEFPIPAARQNPTSGGEPGHRLHRVVAGDTLASIAYAEYGDAGQWRRIADANRAVSDPMRLAPGLQLLVPPA